MSTYKIADVNPSVRFPLKRISRKRSVFVTITESGTDNANTWWDGGSRRVLSRLDLATGEIVGIAGTNPPQFGGKVVDIPMARGYVIIDCGTFCGKPATPRLYVHPSDVGAVIGQELVADK
ncbi:MAG: hypothetical protein ACYSWO_26160 [Planctomycetota bacterium]|jgi:hypothetical protein